MMRQRPLSPHLQVYRLPLTGILSICHRISGFALFFSLLIFVCWLAVLGHSEDCYRWSFDFFGTLVGQAIVWLSVFAFFYHFSNGIRHMIWDCGYGFEKTTSYRSSILVIVVSVILTLLVWGFCS